MIEESLSRQVDSLVEILEAQKADFTRLLDHIGQGEAAVRSADVSLLLEMEKELDASGIALVVLYQMDCDALNELLRSARTKNERWAQRVEVVKQASCVSVDVYVCLLLLHGVAAYTRDLANCVLPNPDGPTKTKKRYRGLATTCSSFHLCISGNVLYGRSERWSSNSISAIRFRNL